MSLRFRLIVAFFLLSVVPLGAVTYYSYRTNAQAVREAAGREAELLAGDLTDRMQLVTAQLGQQFQRLMEMPATAGDEPVLAAALRSGADQPAAAADSATATPAPAARAMTEAEQMAEILGETAVLLNNIDVRGLRRGRSPREGGQGGRGDPAAAGGSGGIESPAARVGGPGQAPAGQSDAPVQAAPGDQRQAGEPGAGAGAAAADGQTGRGGQAGPTDPSQRFNGGGRRGGGSRGRPPGEPPVPPDGPPPEGQPDVVAQGGESRGNGRGGNGRGDALRGRGAPPPDEPEDRTRIQIDLRPVRREILREIAPDAERFEQLSTEERRRIIDAVNERVLGIQQGIQIVQQEAAERAAEARAEAARSGVPPPPAPPTPPSAPAAPQAPGPATGPQQPAAAARVQRLTELSGSRLDVRLEQDGEVLGEVNAEINVPNLLAAVFTAARRDRGEVPFAIDQAGQLYTPTLEDRERIEAIGSPIIAADSPTATAVSGNWVVVTTADPTGSEVKFGIARPLGEALDELRRTAARNAGLGLGLIGLALIGIVPLSGRLTRNLDHLTEGVSRISQGDYRARVQVRSRDEIGTLAVAFNRMAEDVERHQKAAVEQERLRRELELGRQIQNDMLPPPLRLGLTEMRGVSVPAREVGGDFFNYFETDAGKIALLVGDVSGKGVGAALLMANIQASLRTRLALGQDLASIAGALDHELDRDLEATTPGLYATLFVGLLDPATRQLEYVNAGHNPQYVLRRAGGLERMSSTGLPMGLLAGRGYGARKLQLERGDVLFFYTDGCVEAEDASGEMFGVERLEHLLLGAASHETADVLASAEAEIARFRSGREPHDDATMMVVNVG